MKIGQFFVQIYVKFSNFIKIAKKGNYCQTYPFNAKKPTSFRTSSTNILLKFTKLLLKHPILPKIHSILPKEQTNAGKTQFFLTTPTPAKKLKFCQNYPIISKKYPFVHKNTLLNQENAIHSKETICARKMIHFFPKILYTALLPKYLQNLLIKTALTKKCHNYAENTKFLPNKTFFCQI